MADTKIRNLPAHILPVIDSRAKKNKQSREEYLRDLLVRHVESEFLTEQANNFTELTKSCLLILEKNTTALNEFIKMNSEEIE